VEDSGDPHIAEELAHPRAMDLLRNPAKKTQMLNGTNDQEKTQPFNRV
jgi:hypothetical protein